MSENKVNFNMVLEELISNFESEKSEENYKVIIDELISSMDGVHSFYIPMHLISMGNENKGYLPSTLSASNGKWYYIAFTSDKTGIEAVGNQEATVMQIENYLKFIRDSKEAGGLCINPGNEKGVFVPVELLQQLIPEEVTE